MRLVLRRTIVDEERIFTLMMDALDDELDEQGSAELVAYLAEHPDLAQEWEAMQWVDNLLVTTPPVAAPDALVAHTLARLPAPRLRRLFLFLGFDALLLVGLLPIVAGLALVRVDLGAVIGTSLQELWVFGRVFTTAITATLRSVLATQPQVWAYLAVMLGILVAWRIVYYQMSATLQPIPLPPRSDDHGAV